MAKAPRKRTYTKSGWDPLGLIRAITDAVERVGADNAFYGTIIVLSFALVACRTNVFETLLLDAGLTVIWVALKVCDGRLKERKTKFELQCLREARGLELLKMQGKLPDQLTFLDGEDK